MKTDLVIQVDTFGKYCEDDDFCFICNYATGNFDDIDCVDNYSCDIFGENLKEYGGRLKRCKQCLNAEKH